VLTFKPRRKAVRKECEAAKLVRAISILRNVPGKRMFSVPDNSGNVRAVNTTQVNAFLREIAGIKISLKDFRTLMASAAVLESLSRISPAASARGRRKQSWQPCGLRPMSYRIRRRSAAKAMCTTPSSPPRGRHPRALCGNHEGLSLAIETRAAFGPRIAPRRRNHPSARIWIRCIHSRNSFKQKRWIAAARYSSLREAKCRHNSYSPPILQTIFHSSAVTGCTDSASISRAPCRPDACQL